MERPIYDFNDEKNLMLLKQRGIGFEDIIAILDSGGCLAIIDHPNPAKYPHQKIYIVDVSGYAYLVPFETLGDKLILKTIYPSRKLTKKYLKRE